MGAHKLYHSPNAISVTCTVLFYTCIDVMRNLQSLFDYCRRCAIIYIFYTPLIFLRRIRDHGIYYDRGWLLHARHLPMCHMSYVPIFIFLLQCVITIRHIPPTLQTSGDT